METAIICLAVFGAVDIVASLIVMGFIALQARRNR